jgi:hypothetical protein
MANEKSFRQALSRGKKGHDMYEGKHYQKASQVK